jgi:N-methylhydantoinase A
VLGAPVELVSVRAVGTGRTVRASLATDGPGHVAAGAPAPRAGTRRLRTERGDDATTVVDVFDGAGLLPGHSVEGPALVDGADTTVWVPAHALATVTPQGTLSVELGR